MVNPHETTNGGIPQFAPLSPSSPIAAINITVVPNQITRPSYDLSHLYVHNEYVTPVTVFLFRLATEHTFLFPPSFHS